MSKTSLAVDSFKEQYLDLFFDLCFDQRVLMLSGDSGTGKSFVGKVLYSFRDKYNIKYFDYHDIEKKEEVLQEISRQKNTLFVFDNADILLGEELRNAIIRDRNNQYLIIGRNTNGLFLRSNNLVDISINNGVVRFIHML